MDMAAIVGGMSGRSGSSQCALIASLPGIQDSSELNSQNEIITLGERSRYLTSRRKESELRICTNEESWILSCPSGQFIREPWRFGCPQSICIHLECLQAFGWSNSPFCRIILAPECEAGLHWPSREFQNVKVEDKDRAKVREKIPGCTLPLFFSCFGPTKTSSNHPVST